MKKLLSILGTMALTTTASTSVIACDKDKKEEPKSSNPPTGQPGTTNGPTVVSAITLNQQVAKDLGLIDKNGISLVEVGINGLLAPNYVKWDFKGKFQHNPFSNNITNIKATKLLNADNKAVSPESEYFLINTLKLIKNATDNTFNRDNARNITVLTSEIKPTLSKTTDGSDYEVTGGTFKLQFVKQGENLGDNYTINLKGNNVDIIQPIFNTFFIDYNSFNPIDDFIVTQNNQNNINTKPEIGVNVYKFLKKESDVYKKLESLNDLLIDTGDKVSIIVTGRETTGTNWIRGNSLKVKIKFGTIIQKGDNSLTLS